MRHRLPIAALMASTASLACHVVEMERIPTEGDIRSWEALRPFIVQADALTGVYQNLDVDSVVFTYRSKASEAEFWQELGTLAVTEGWAPLPGPTASLRRYSRLRSQGSLTFSSSEELRVSYSASRVVVGYVQSDQDGAPRPVAEASEGRFAAKHVWPRFEAAVTQNAG